MSSDQELRSQINRGARVASFIDDDDIKAVFAKLEQSYVDSVLSDQTSPAWHRYHALRDVLIALDDIVLSGKMAATQLGRKSERT